MYVLGRSLSQLQVSALNSQGGSRAYLSLEKLVSIRFTKIVHACMSTEATYQNPI